MELHPECAQLGVRQLRFQLGSTQLPLPVFAIVIGRMTESNERPVGKQVKVESGYNEFLEDVCERLTQRIAN